ncbi:unnamed protein product [Cuscuta campestris]|uniref:Uncharacterized protein n=1 Tax=Cuscuta campestris TaxID=132261 RepID=A0A484KSS0_9ASTE|nr:unnamed protein product [Cuscuta campestris]
MHWGSRCPFGVDAGGIPSSELDTIFLVVGNDGGGRGGGGKGSTAEATAARDRRRRRRRQGIDAGGQERKEREK